MDDARCSLHFDRYRGTGHHVGEVRRAWDGGPRILLW